MKRNLEATKFCFILITMLMMCAGLMGQTATAPASGDGTEGSPYQIATLNNLYWITQNSSSWDKYFIQTSDIDASDTQDWMNGLPKIGWANPSFNGSYDGQNYRISELYINRTETAALFAYIGSTGFVENIKLTDCQIIGAGTTGSIAARNQGTINNCFSNGTVSGSYDVGGMVGLLWGGSISDCRTECSVNATSTNVGGFVGYLLSGSITRSWAKGDVVSSYSGNAYVGGFVGLNTGTISYSYSEGDATGHSYIGAFAGSNEPGGTISNCFSQGDYWGTGTELGGLAGENRGNISYCYSLACGQLTHPGHPHINEGSSIGYNFGTATELIYYTESLNYPGCGDNQGTFTATAIRNSSLLRLQSTYTDAYPAWDFTNHWEIKSNVITRYGFAQFQWENIPPPVSTAPAQIEGVYQIGTLDELRWMAENTGRWSYDYQQTADIDFTDAVPSIAEWINFYGTGWTSIGQLWSGTKFSGSFDGGSFTISGLYQNKRAATGLFGEISSTGTVDNVGLIDANITTTETQGGVLASINAGAISKCYTSGSLNAKQEAGGLIGKNTGSVSNCYSHVNVTRGSGSETSLGGLVGLHSSGTISNCYATGWVKDEFGSVGGGFAGTVDTGTFSNCFWDTQTSETSSSAGSGSGVTGKTTAEMKTSSTFTGAGWDFSDIWEMIGVNYPRLKDNPDPALPVTLSSFEATYSKNQVILNWTTQSETDNLGWNLFRSEIESGYANGDYFSLNSVLIPGMGTTTTPTNYSFADEYPVIEGRTYWYWLQSVSTTNELELFGPISLEIPFAGQLPVMTILQTNYPNPFNPQTTIAFSIKENEEGTLSIYNLRGERILTETFSSGDHQYSWNAEGLASGIYFYKLTSPTTNMTRKMLLLR